MKRYKKPQPRKDEKEKKMNGKRLIKDGGNKNIITYKKKMNKEKRWITKKDTKKLK